MSRVKTSPLRSVTPLFIVTAAIESGAGLALLVAPAAIVGLLFGPVADVFPAAGVARVTGVALLSLGAACWWARYDGRGAASIGLVRAMLVYNVAVAALVIAGALGALGPLQWAGAVLHGIQAIWCVVVVAALRR
jgi:hypothetical protein